MARGEGNERDGRWFLPTSNSKCEGKDVAAVLLLLTRRSQANNFLLRDLCSELIRCHRRQPTLAGRMQSTMQAISATIQTTRRTPWGRNKKVDGRPNPKIAFCSARGGLRETLRFFATCEVGKQNFSIDTHSLEPNWVTRRCPARLNLSAQSIPICKFVAGEDFSSGSHGVSIPDTPCFPVTHLRSRSG